MHLADVVVRDVGLWGAVVVAVGSVCGETVVCHNVVLEDENDTVFGGGEVLVVNVVDCVSVCSVVVPVTVVV